MEAVPQEGKAARTRPRLMTKPMEIKVARVRHRYSQKYLADALGISVTTYRHKEDGVVMFNDPEKLKLMEVLQLSMQQFNDYFFDGRLPIGQ